MMQTGGTPGDGLSFLIVGHQWPSEMTIAGLNAWIENRGQIANAHHNIADLLNSAKTGPLAVQEGKTADALVQAFDDGEQLARDIAKKNGVKKDSYAAALNSVHNLRDKLSDIADRYNHEIKQIIQSNEPAAVKGPQILAAIGRGQQEANVAAASCGGDIGDAGQRILDQEAAGQSFRQFARANGIDMGQLFRSRDTKDLESTVQGMLTGDGLSGGVGVPGVNPAVSGLSGAASGGGAAPGVNPAVPGLSGAAMGASSGGAAGGGAAAGGAVPGMNPAVPGLSGAAMGGLSGGAAGGGAAAGGAVPGVSPAVSSSSGRGGGARYESVGIEHVRTTDELCHHNARPRPAGSTATGGPAWSWAVSAVGSSWVSCEFAGRAAGSWTAGSSWVSCEFAGRAAGSWAVAAVGPSSVSRELADGDTWFAPRHACRSHADVQSCVLRFRRRPPVRLAQHAFQRSGFPGGAAAQLRPG